MQPNSTSLTCVPNAYYYPAGCGKVGQPCCEDSGPGLRLLWNCQPGAYCQDFSGYSGEHGGGVGVWYNNHTCIRCRLECRWESGCACTQRLCG